MENVTLKPAIVAHLTLAALCIFNCVYAVLGHTQYWRLQWTAVAILIVLCLSLLGEPDKK